MLHTPTNDHEIARIACAVFTRMVFALLLWALATGAHAATAYRCTDAHGNLAYQDTPCAAHARQHEVTLQPQPLIGAPGETVAAKNMRSHDDARAPQSAHRPRAATRHARTQPAMSWECRAADGEVFYRHTHCPSSIPGDGVVRDRYAEKIPSTRGRHNAWSRVRVHGVKIPRAEACLRIHAVAASSRDGYLHDENVSVYDHLMGRDPCAGA